MPVGRRLEAYATAARIPYGHHGSSEARRYCTPLQCCDGVRPGDIGTLAESRVDERYDQVHAVMLEVGNIEVSHAHPRV